MKTSLKFDNLIVKLSGHIIIEDLSVDIKPGERIAIEGRSGSGKSTLLRTILGFIVPFEGKIFVEEDELNPENINAIRLKIAYLAQEPELGDGQVKDILERPFHYKANLKLIDNLQKADKLFEEFLLPISLMNEKISTLSGGEKQRLALISSLLLDRNLLLLDEASSALDKESVETIRKYFENKSNLTILSVSHGRSLIKADSKIRLTPPDNGA